MAWIVAGGWQFGPSIFAEGWSDAVFSSSGSLYDLVDESITKIPLIKYTKGAMAVYTKDDLYSGCYTVGLYAVSGGYPISGTWTFFMEHPATTTASGFTFQAYANVTADADNYGKVSITLRPSGSFAVANFFDDTGTSGGFFGVWATLGTQYVTNYETIPYRIIDLEA